jgi:hypothetical protein
MLGLAALHAGNENVYLVRSMVSSLQGNPVLLPESEAQLVEQYRDLARMGNPSLVDRERLLKGETTPQSLRDSSAFRPVYAQLYVRAAAGEDVAASELLGFVPIDAMLLYGAPAHGWGYHFRSGSSGPSPLFAMAFTLGQSLSGTHLGHALVP